MTYNVLFCTYYLTTEMYCSKSETVAATINMNNEKRDYNDMVFSLQLKAEIPETTQPAKLLDCGFNLDDAILIPQQLSIV